MNNELYCYTLRLTTLSPVHIGTGEVYEPTAFTVDKGKFFEFDEMLFYRNLTKSDRIDLNTKLDDWMDIIDFYRTKKEEAKKIAKFECPISSKAEESYRRLYNNDGTKKQNQFQIAKTFKNPNTYDAIIPGSSIKGMLDTVFQIYIGKADNSIRQNLIVSDAILQNGSTEIGYCYRKHKNPEREAKSDIPQIVEIISKKSVFSLTIRTKYTFQEIQKKFQRYHKDRPPITNAKTDNSFIARIGKFSGKAYMVDNGKNVLNNDGKSVATHTLFENGDEFGWVKFEILNLEKQPISIPDELLNFRKRLIASIEGKGIKIKYLKNKLYQKFDTDEETINTFIKTLNLEVKADNSIEPSDVLMLLDKVIENDYELIFADRITKECDCTMDELVSFAEDENIDIVNEKSIVSIKIFDDIKKYI